MHVFISDRTSIFNTKPFSLKARIRFLTTAHCWSVCAMVAMFNIMGEPSSQLSFSAYKDSQTASRTLSKVSLQHCTKIWCPVPTNLSAMLYHIQEGRNVPNLSVNIAPTFGEILHHDPWFLVPILLRKLVQHYT